MTIERFEYHDSTTFKYWEIQVVGATTLIRFGRVGTSGTNVAKKHASAQAAQADADKLIREKKRKGYVEYSPDRVTPMKAAAAPASAKKAPKKKAPGKKNAPGNAPAKKKARPNKNAPAKKKARRWASAIAKH
jgi:predicted DNA-binding WGR domain protein